MDEFFTQTVDITLEVLDKVFSRGFIDKQAYESFYNLISSSQSAEAVLRVFGELVDLTKINDQPWSEFVSNL